MAAPAGFKESYAELQRHGFALGNAITDKGDEALGERLFGTDPNSFRWPRRCKGGVTILLYKSRGAIAFLISGTGKAAFRIA